MALTLVIGNKNYSSWSFRPWIAMKTAGIAFEEVLISLEGRGLQGTRLAKFPALARCRCWSTATVKVWESLAILEYLAEKFPRPEALAGRSGGARARARCRLGDARGLRAAAQPLPDEHVASGDQARPARGRRRQRQTHRRALDRLPDAGSAPAGRSCSAASARRTPCTRRWCPAFTPTGSRWARAAQAYMAAVMALPAWAEWRAAALKEPWVLPHDEAGLADRPARPDFSGIFRAAPSRHLAVQNLMPRTLAKQGVNPIFLPRNRHPGSALDGQDRFGVQQGREFCRRGSPCELLPLCIACRPVLPLRRPCRPRARSAGRREGPVPADRLPRRHRAAGHHLDRQSAPAELRAAARAAVAVGVGRAVRAGP